MSEIRFTIPGRLNGKGRPRFTTVGGFPRAYTPAATRTEEKLVGTLARAAMRGIKPLEGPIWLDIAIVQRPPPSWSKKKTQAANWITQKPDCDNVLKLVSDSLNEIVYADDAQIAKISAERVWRLSGDERVEVTIRTLE